MKITLPPLSKPRNVDGSPGATGGKLTAGATWKPPTDAGGLAIKGYQIVGRQQASARSTRRWAPAKRKLL